MKGIIGSLILLVLVACSEQKNETASKQATLESMEANLKTFEDSLKVHSQGIQSQEIGVIYAEKCLAIAHTFPKSKEAPKYMNKAHIIFSTVGLQQRAVLIGDTLIRNYPAYEKRAMVLESLAAAYDVYIQPRQKDKVKHYYELLLEENPKMPTEQKEQIEKRLKYIDLSFKEFIQQTN